MVDPRVSTIDTPSRYGGLLVCGMNYGIPKDGVPQPETEFKPWAEYFTHYSNRKSDRFVSRLATWFEWWGIPLESNGTPTELNLAISQTNLFYDSSKSFKARSEEELKLAFKRLTILIDGLNISGLLLASVSMADEAKRKLFLPDWDVKTVGRFSFRHSSTRNLHVAVCPHPRCPQSQQDVKSLGGEMRDWIELVLKEYNMKQARLKI